MIGSPSLVPEVQLHLATAGIEALWAADADRPPPYYAFPWAGGLALARYLLDHRAVVLGKQVLDLGTGSGLVAIAAMVAGAQSVLATDIDPRAIEAARRNAALNGVTIELAERDVLDERPNVDVIVMGDVSYERPLAERVRAFVARNPIPIFIGDPGRAHFDDRGLERLARYEVGTAADLEGRTQRAAGVYRLR